MLGHLNVLVHQYPRTVTWLIMWAATLVVVLLL